MSIEQALELAVQFFEQGKLDQAQSVCESILKVAPDLARTHQILGGIEYRRGNLSAAEDCFLAATRSAPNVSDYFDNLAMIQNARGDGERAISAAQTAIRLNPGFVSAWNNLGLGLRQQRRFAEAEAAFRRGLEINPQSVQILNNLSNLLRDLGRSAEAETACRQALQWRPDVVETWVNLGAALHEQGQHAAAISAFDEALRRKPNFAQAAFNRGATYEAIHQLSEAAGSYELALQLAPGLLTARNNLGVVRKLQGRLDDAISHFQESLRMRPDYMVARTNLLAALQCHASITPERLLAAHREWDTFHASQFRSEWSHPSTAAASQVRTSQVRAGQLGTSDGSLRVGFVSPDFGNHPVGRFLIRAFERLPKSIHTVCFSDRIQVDPLTLRFRAAASSWHETRLLNDDELTQRIRSENLDVLIDLAGHTGRHRLLVFARKPVPIQATWIGYPGTTGIAAMDYLIADRVLIPDACQNDFSEQVVWLDGPSLSFESPEGWVDEAPIETAIPDDQPVTFGSFNKLDKTTPEVIRTWSEILQRVPGSQLHLRNAGLSDEPTRNGILAQFQECGVDAERIICHGWAAHAELLSAYQTIDLALDTFPFSGGATSADALWMGTPLITLCGSTFASRQTTSLLVHSGLGEFVATSQRQYVDKTVDWALSPQTLRAMRSHVRTQFRTGPICDGSQLATSLAEVLHRIALTEEA